MFHDVHNECSYGIHDIPNSTHEIYEIHRIHSRVPSPVLVLSSCSWASLGHWIQTCDFWCCFLWVATFFVLPSLGKNYVRSHAKGPGPPAHALHQSTYLLLVYFSATWNMLPPLLKNAPRHRRETGLKPIVGLDPTAG